MLFALATIAAGVAGVSAAQAKAAFPLNDTIVYNGETFDFSAFGVDPCFLASNYHESQTYYLPSEVAVACLDNIPFNQEVSDTISKLLINTLNEYAFLDIAKKSPTPEFPIKNDMVKRIKDINKKTWPTDRQLQAAYKQVFTDALDAHTLYYPACMSAYRFLQPFDLHTVLEGNSQVVKVGNVIRAGDELLQSKWSEYFAEKTPAELRNYTILTINGKSPVSYLKDVAHHSIGTYKDIQTRFNFASGSVQYEGNGKTSYNYGYSQLRIDPPAKLVNRYKLRSPEGEVIFVSYPWIGVQPGRGYADTKTFYSNLCQPNFYDVMMESKVHQEDTDSKGRVNPLIADNYVERDVFGRIIPIAGPGSGMGELYESNKILYTPTELVNFGYEKPINMFRNLQTVGITSATYSDDATVSRSLDGVYPIPVLEGAFSAFYLVTENVGVAWIPSFAPQGECTIKGKEDFLSKQGSLKGFYCFIDELSRGYKALKNKGARKVIIDFSGNGGGYVVLGTIHNKILFGDKVPATDRDYRLSPLVKHLFETGFDGRYYTSFHAANFLSTNLTTFDSIDEFFAGNYEDIRGGATSEYTQRVLFNDGFQEENEQNPLFALGVKLPKRPIFKAEDIIMLTDGGCGSTCAQTALQLHGLYGVEAVVKGGMNKHKPFSFTAFPGGNVIDYRQIFGEIRALGAVNRPDAPVRPMNYNVLALRVDFSETYSYIHPKIPAEYDFIAGTKRYDIDTESFWPPTMWKKVAGDLKITPKKPRKPRQPKKTVVQQADESMLEEVAEDFMAEDVSEATRFVPERVFSHGGLPPVDWLSQEQDDIEMADEYDEEEAARQFQQAQRLQREQARRPHYNGFVEQNGRRNRFSQGRRFYN